VREPAAAEELTGAADEAPPALEAATGIGTVSVAPASGMTVELNRNPPAEDGTEGIGGMYALLELGRLTAAEDD
jgi:hypothetical protein